MGKSQWIAIAVTSFLLLFTYWGCPVRPPELEEGLTQAPLAATGLESLIRAARADLTPAAMATLASLEERLETQTDDEQRMDLLEQLAGEWYRAGHPAISGIYAERIAEQLSTVDAWSIAGTTFTICIQREEEDNKTRQFCANQAEKAYQAAISLEPDDVNNRINLALTYVDAPAQGNPMQGILQLLDLVEKYPREPRVYTTLAQLAIKTGQLDKAAERLETAAELDPGSPDALCPLARVYDNLGNTEKSAIFAARCTAALEEKSANDN
ncbi:tetratricopeptide repeat protein [Neolewinella antarctica]|uniref:Tetratricopeptide (TPR) repeat protein n=1 Tax=Neolewinella antarctica TaxID=442734 RepID=A0ABX0XBM4_9BACT|nr:tetratricopeptide repeat protein [Neolewinella antarctica]NJC26177.1 tetratricopeptide (TPR) repeat protein [Neolewinella antarctica]